MVFIITVHSLLFQPKREVCAALFWFCRGETGAQGPTDPWGNWDQWMLSSQGSEVMIGIIELIAEIDPRNLVQPPHFTDKETKSSKKAACPKSHANIQPPH